MPLANSAHQNYKLDLAILSVFQNEAPYLKEWIEFHRMIGVQCFFLVNDRSTDHFVGVLKPYVKEGIVKLLNHPCPSWISDRSWEQYQIGVINQIVKQLLGVCKWLAIIDIDEFIVPTNEDNLLNFLLDYENFGGIYVRWDPFGTSYIEKLSKSDLITEKLYLKWKFIRGHNMLGKSIVKPENVLHGNIHQCELIPTYKYFDSNPGMRNEFPEIKINHYWSRDIDFLLNTKLPRKSRISGWEIDEKKIEFFKELFNEVPDYSMSRFIPELKRRLFKANKQ